MKTITKISTEPLNGNPRFFIQLDCQTAKRSQLNPGKQKQ